MNILKWLRGEFYLITALMTFTVYTSNDSFLPAMEPIANFFGTSIATVNMSMAVLILGICLPQIPIGMLSDKIGRRPLILAGGVIFMAATFMITRVPSIEYFMVCRFFQGMGCSCIVGTAGAMINEHYQYKKRIFALSTVSQLSILAPMMGPLIGTYILSFSNDQWEYIYIYNNYVFFVFFIFALFCVPETLPEKLEELEKSKPKQTENLNNPQVEQINHTDVKAPKETIWQIFKVKSYTYLAFAIASRSFITVIWVAGSAKAIMIDMGYSKEIYSYSQLPIFIALLLGNALVGKIGHTFLPSKYIRKHIYISLPILFILFAITMIHYDIYTLTIFLSALLFATGSILPMKDSMLLTPFKSKGLASGLTLVIRSGVNVIASALPALLFDFHSTIILSIIIGALIFSAVCGLLAIPHLKQIERNLN